MYEHATIDPDTNIFPGLQIVEKVTLFETW